MVSTKHKLLLVLLLLDALFICAYLASIKIASSDIRLFSPGTDGGYPELFQYLKWSTLIVIFVLMARNRHRMHELSWALVFSYFLIDDAFRVHEQVGTIIANSFEFKQLIGLRAQDFGELAVSAIAGSILAVSVIAAYLYGSRHFKNMSKDLVILIGGLVFFGVICDLVDIYFINKGVDWKFSLAIEMLEEGGEMAIASVFVAFSYWLLLQPEGEQSRLTTFVHRQNRALGSN